MTGLRFLPKKLAFLCLVIPIFAQAHAADIDLKWNRDYDQTVASLSSGDVVHVREFRPKYRFFGRRTLYKTHTFMIDQFLGAGGQTRVFSLRGEPDKVLRLAISREAPFSDGQDGIDFRAPPVMMREMQNGYKELAEQGVPVTRIFDEFPGLFIVAERAEGPTLDLFIKNHGFFTRQQLNEMTDALRAFARATSMFENIGDFRADQIVYVRSRGQWILRDWSSNHSLFKGKSLLTLFGRYLGYESDYTMNDIPKVERDKAGNLQWTWAAHLLIELETEALNERARRGYQFQVGKLHALENYAEGGVYGRRRNCQSLLSDNDVKNSER